MFLIYGGMVFSGLFGESTNVISTPAIVFVKPFYFTDYFEMCLCMEQERYIIILVSPS